MSKEQPVKDITSTTGFATMASVVFIHLIRKENFSADTENVLIYAVPFASLVVAYFANLLSSLIPPYQVASKNISRWLYMRSLQKDLSLAADEEEIAIIKHDLREIKIVIRKEKHQRNLLPPEEQLPAKTESSKAV
jgi:hypothetical protein